MSAEKRTPLGALLLLWFAGHGLRIPILAIPPILALVIVDLNLTGTEVGILNGIPVALFALAAMPGSLLISRVGAVPALVIGLSIAAAGSMLRGLAPGTLALFAATVVMSAGIAVMQPALPPTVRQWVPQRVGFATAVYTNGLLVGEIVTVAITIPFILPLLNGSWRGSLVFWSIPNVLVALAIYLFQPRGVANAQPPKIRRWMPDWRDPLLWKVGFMMSGANQLYFCANAFLPGLLMGNGQTDLIAPALMGLNGGQVPASLLLLMMASRWERKRWPPLVAGLLALLSVFGMVGGTGWWITASALLAGFSSAFILTVVLALPPLLVAPDDVSRMSAGVFTIGYGMAMIVSVLGGVAWDLTGQAAFAFLPIALGALPILFVTPFVDLSQRRS